MSDTVAVVEDDPDIQSLVCEILQTDGFAVACFATPDVLSMGTTTPRPTIFLIDLMLPQMTGIELASVLRRDGFIGTPMIAISASRFMLRLASVSGLFQEIVPKPFNLSTLLSSVEHWALMKYSF